MINKHINNIDLSEGFIMKLSFNNISKFPVKIGNGTEVYEIYLNRVKEIAFNDKYEVTLSITEIAKKAKSITKNSLNKLFLNVSCTYCFEFPVECDTVIICDEFYEFESNLLLPFAYHYLKINNGSEQFKLISCKATNVKSIKKLYFCFALMCNGGFDFLLNIFSIIFQIHRIKKLCKNDKIYDTLKAQQSS